jgi:hypothetical protein
MKKLLKANVTAKTTIPKNEYGFSLSDIENLLLEIRELENYNIEIKRVRGGSCKITIGESTYEMSDKMQGIYGN